MAVVKIEATQRDKMGSRTARKYRQEGYVPGVFYIDGKESIPLLFESKKMSYFLHHAHGLVDLSIGGEKEDRKCVLKDVQYDPITDEALHVDFLGVNMGEKLHLSVPLVLHGTPAGIKSGGILQFLTREVEIECLPKDIPDNLDIDVSELEIGDSIQIQDLKYENIVILNEPNETVALVDVPKISVADLEEAAEEAEEEMEPEVIGSEEESEEEEEEKEEKE